MKIKVISAGAAGNKAAINLIEKGIINKKDILLLNSTLRDVPSDYKDMAIQYSTNRAGAGKERSAAKSMCLESIQNGSLDCLDKLITDEDDAVVIVASTEGGTGSGSSLVLAKYFNSVLGIPVHIFAFTGFEDDNRGLQNTIEFFQEVEEDYTVQAISNKKFLDIHSNKLKAEKAANDEFANRISILIGKDIIESEQNIDETDLFKVSTTPGYMTIGKTNIDRIKNTDQFNKLVSDMLDNSVSLDTPDKTVKRLGVFINASDRTNEIIDHSFTVFKTKLGVPYELFTHIQYDESKEESVSFIASGLNMPIDEVRDIYNKYKKEVEKINTKKDNFFDFVSGLEKTEDKVADKKKLFKDMFDMGETIQQPKKEVQQIVEDKKDFVNSFGVSFGRRKVEPVQEPVVVSDEVQSGDRKNVKLTREEYLKNNF